MAASESDRTWFAQRKSPQVAYDQMSEILHEPQVKRFYRSYQRTAKHTVAIELTGVKSRHSRREMYNATLACRLSRKVKQPFGG